MRGSVECRIEVAVPAAALWDFVTDWPRQGEWIPATRVERIDSADHVGGRLRAWTGLGSLGFWDPMTITSWERTETGGGRCEVLHLGTVVKGEGVFEVVAGPTTSGVEHSTFVWSELVVVPAGPLGRWAWPLARRVVATLVDVALRRMRDIAQREHGAGAG